jgi:hypothetical protein
MSQINYAGVLKGGVVAALIMLVSEAVLNVPIIGVQMDLELAARNLPPVSAGAFGVFSILTLLLGFLTVWLYAAIRPRLGPGPRTAMVAGLVVWATTYLYSAIAFGVLGVNSMGLIVVAIVWTLIEMIVASAAGAYFYNEA